MSWFMNAWLASLIKKQDAFYTKNVLWKSENAQCLILLPYIVNSCYATSCLKYVETVHWRISYVHVFHNENTPIQIYRNFHLQKLKIFR